MALALATPALAGAADWRLEQPAPPANSPYATPLGHPGDVQFLAPNRGLVSVEGNNLVPPGQFFFDGKGWHQLSTVCDGTSARARIAWAGPDEFWTITYPSPPRGTVFGTGTSLCHFQDGYVADSFSTASTVDPYLTVTSAACTSPSNCWFGGSAGQDGYGQRRGGFHLHWDGSSLKTEYAPQGRQVTDATASGESVLESLRRSGDENGFQEPILEDPEPQPRLIHRIAGGAFSSEPFALAPAPNGPDGDADFRAIDSDGRTSWAVGNGPGRDGNRGLVAAVDTGNGWREVTVDVPDVDPGDQLVDVAVVPGTQTAWAAVAPGNVDANPTQQRARVVKLGPGGVQRDEEVPDPGSPRGPAWKLDCTAVDDCWMATYTGWLYHLSDGQTYPQVTDPAFQGTITYRPNEAIEQFVPDDPPIDDSAKFAPPPIDLPKPAESTVAKRCAVPPALVAKVRAKLRGTKAQNRRRSRLTLDVTFSLRRTARIGLVASRGRRTVARRAPLRLRPGKRRLSVAVTRKRFPNKLALSRKELTKLPCKPAKQGSDDDDTIVTSSAPRR